MVTRIRQHQTKTGKPMGFVTLEDLQGNIELILFPKVWDRFGHLVTPDAVLVVEGKVDGEGGGDPKVLVDAVKVQTLDQAEIAEDEVDLREPSDGGYIEGWMEEEVLVPAPVPARIAEPASPAFPSDDWLDDAPPPPPDPDDWYELRPAKPAARPSAPAPAAPARLASSEEQAPVRAAPRMALEAPDLPPAVTAASQAEAVSYAVQYMHPPAEALGEQAEEPSEYRMLTLILRSQGDKQRDVLRLRRLYGELVSSPGRDRFGMMIVEGGHTFLMEFPNQSTGITPELLTRLKAMVGEENIKIERVKIQ